MAAGQGSTPWSPGTRRRQRGAAAGRLRCEAVGSCAARQPHRQQGREGPKRQLGRTLSSCMSLSMPRGPSVVRTTSATAAQALMLEMSCGFPWLVSVPSFSRMIWGCCSSQKRGGRQARRTISDGRCLACPRRGRSWLRLQSLLTMPNGSDMLSPALPFSLAGV